MNTQEKTIGQIISELEENLKMCKEADRIINEWKFMFTLASDEVKPQMLKEMLYSCGIPPSEINKMVRQTP